MARILKPPFFESVVNPGEKRLLDFLEVNLPDDFYLIPNVEITSTNPRNGRTQTWEYDLIVVAPHAIFNIENKDWKGRIEGDENYWYLNDRQRPNPLKTGRQKTAVLVSKLKEQQPYWGKAWIQNMVTLSYPNTFIPILSYDESRLTFELKEQLIHFICDPERVNKPENDIKSLQKEIVDYLIGTQSVKAPDQKKQVLDYEIIEVLHKEVNYTEYLVKLIGVTSSIRRRVKEYSMQVTGLSPGELKTREEAIKNQYKALNKIKAKPFILNVEFKIDPENHLFYEISDFLDENSLRAEIKKKTFTFQEKVNVIKNLMAALKEAHKENIYHRDINPDNVFVSGGYAYLGNFGKSYFTDHDEQGYTVMATISEINATPYHPLELTVGDASRSSDIYSLGVLIYWLFTGKEPFKSPYELDRIGGKLPPERLPTTINPYLPGWLDELCDKTILTDGFQRMDSIEELEAFLNNKLNPKKTGEETPKPQVVPSYEGGMEELKEGDKIGDFTIYKTLGKGGYSKVFKVKHSLQGVDYALKLFHESVNINSVKDEYNALKNLNHPNIVKFAWNGTAPTGQFFTITEFLDGENLGKYVHSDVRLPISRVYQLGKEILSALVAMQEQEKPLYHRDIKPQNIILADGNRFVLIDFNVAAFADDNQDFVGTNPYLAPDLISDDHKINWDKSADTFALGITMFELICKRHPWAPNKVPMISASPLRPNEVEPRLSDEFSDFLFKAVNPKKHDRFSSAKEMLAGLGSINPDNLLKENDLSGQGINNDQLYHIEVLIYQEGFNLKLYDKMEDYVHLNKAVETTLLRFKENLRNYGSSISLQKPIGIQLKLDSKVMISEKFWAGEARNFTEGNIEKVYQKLLEVFENNREQIKAYKVAVEGEDIVGYINSLYSQSRHGNFGTRAGQVSSEFDKLTYSHSKLDRKLIPDILDGRYKLLIITGNAGDGKTAFIRKIEEDQGAMDLERFEHKNGARFKINDIPFESNYDGSQDQEEKANNVVLEEFFKPFENLRNFDKADEGRIIAINEGRLVEFLNTSGKYGWLGEIIENYFYEEGHFQLPDGLMIINLNLRSIVASNDAEASLFRKQVRVLTQRNLWSKCEICPVAGTCFIKYNVDSFNDPAVGEEIITRMEWLLRTVNLKKELHITMRDLRSFIAFMLTRDQTCEDIEKLHTSFENIPEEFWQYFYFNISSPEIKDSGSKDRLIKLLRETDIGEVSLPDLDRDLFFGRHNQKDFLEFSNRKISLLDAFNQNKIWVPAHEQSTELLKRIKTIQKSFSRHFYFEGKSEYFTINNLKKNGSDENELKMPSFLLRIPYNSVFRFVHLLNEGDKDELTKNSISKAISLNEGCDNQLISQNYLVLSSSEIKDPISKSYRLFELRDFELFVNRTDHLVKYLEYEPDSLTFRHRTESHIKLVITLDLYEMLFFIQQGFSPSLNDLKGKFVELIIFKNLLENLTYKEVVVTRDNLEFFKIGKNDIGQIKFEKMEV